MKKRFLAGFILIAALLAGCRKGTRELSTDNGLECNRNVNHRWGGNFNTTDEAVYYIGTGINESPDSLIYYDKENESSGPLCGKAECLHNDAECNAGMGKAESHGLSVYDGKLYFLYDESGPNHSYTGTYVYSMKPDGTDRKREQLYAAPGDTSYFWTESDYIFHQGQIISYGQHCEIENGKMNGSMIVESYEISSGKRVELYNEKVDYEANTSVMFVQPYADRIYYMTAVSPMREEPDEFDSIGYDFHVRIGSFDIGTKECSTEVEFNIPETPFEFIRKDEGFLVSTTAGVVYEVDSGKAKRYYDFNRDSENFRNIYMSDEYMIGYTYPDLSDHSEYHMCVLTTDRKKVLDKTAENPYCSYGLSYGWTFLGTDKDHVYIAYNDMNSAIEKNYLAEFPINGETVRTIWSNEY